MKSYSLFGVVGTGLAALVAFGACTVNSTTNNSGDDSGTGSSSGGSSDDSATPDGASSSGSSSGASSSSSGSSSGASEGGEEGGSCTANLTIGAADCDTCMKANCCTQLIACDTPDDAGVDDAGNTACESLLDCALNYSNTADASLGDSVSTCAGTSGDASTAASSTLTSLLTCATTSCASQCQ